MRLPLWGRRDREEKLEEEIGSHLQMAVRDRVERGETVQQAEVSARREFGNVTLVKEDTRAMWGWTSVETRPSVRAANDAQHARIQGRRNLAGAWHRADLIRIQRAQRAAPKTFARTRAGAPRPDLSRALWQHFVSELSGSSSAHRHSGVSGRILVAEPGCTRCSGRWRRGPNRASLERRRVSQLF